MHNGPPCSTVATRTSNTNRDNDYKMETFSIHNLSFRVLAVIWQFAQNNFRQGDYRMCKAAAAALQLSLAIECVILRINMDGWINLVDQKLTAINAKLVLTCV